jgi:hypothetical protein
MKKNRTHIYLTLILVANILIYLFKIDRDYFSFQEYYRHPHKTYNEQLLSNNASYFGITSFDYSKLFKPYISDKSNIDQSFIWRSVYISYNSHVHCLLKLHESTTIPTTRIISILHKNNICHRSSEDEELDYRYVA